MPNGLTSRRAPPAPPAARDADIAGGTAARRRPPPRARRGRRRRSAGRARAPAVDQAAGQFSGLPPAGSIPSHAGLGVDPAQAPSRHSLQLGEVAAGGLEGAPGAPTRRQPPRHLLEVAELRPRPACARRAAAAAACAARERAHSRAWRRRPPLVAELDQTLVSTAVEEDVEAPVPLADHADDLARAGHAVDELQGDPLLARRRHGVAAERADRDDGAVPTRGRHPAGWTVGAAGGSVAVTGRAVLTSRAASKPVWRRDLAGMGITSRGLNDPTSWWATDGAGSESSTGWTGS